MRTQVDGKAVDLLLDGEVDLEQPQGFADDGVFDLVDRLAELDGAVVEAVFVLDQPNLAAVTRADIRKYLETYVLKKPHVSLALLSKETQQKLKDLRDKYDKYINISKLFSIIKMK